MKNKKNGFTFVEVIFVLIVIAIISTVTLPVYRGHVRRGIAQEGRNLVSDVNSGEQSYRYRMGYFYTTSSAESQNTKLGVDFRKNKYFTSYTVSTTDNKNNFTVTTTYNGKSIVLVGSVTTKPVITDNFSSSTD